MIGDGTVGSVTLRMAPYNTRDGGHADAGFAVALARIPPLLFDPGPSMDEELITIRRAGRLL